MRFQYQPNRAACRKLQRAHRTGSNVHDEANSGIHLRDHQRAARFQRFQRAWQHVARAQESGRLRRQQNVSGADSNLQLCARLVWAQRNFQLAI